MHRDAGQPVTPDARSKRRRRPLSGLIVVVLPLLLIACTPGAPLRRLSVTLPPSDSINLYRREQYTHGFGVCLGLGGGPDAPLAFVPGTFGVGAVNDFYDGGALGCISKDDYTYRAGFRFDVSSIQKFNPKIVEKAILSWSIERSTVRTGGGDPSGVSSGQGVSNCVGGVLESKTSLHREGLYLPGYPLRSGQGDVTGLVTNWVIRGDPNYGFVLIGLDESYSRNSAACVSIVKNLRLTIDFLHP